MPWYDIAVVILTLSIPLAMYYGFYQFIYLNNLIASGFWCYFGGLILLTMKVAEIQPSQIAKVIGSLPIIIALILAAGLCVLSGYEKATSKSP